MKVRKTDWTDYRRKKTRRGRRRIEDRMTLK
jgi:hypothetical protein